MRIAVTGASGLLGRAVVERCTTEGHQVLGLAKSRAAPPLISLDLLDTSSLREVLQRFKPDVIIHTAAERRPDVVEADPQGSMELNVDVPGRLAEIARDIALELVTDDAHSATAGTEAETPTEGGGKESPLLIYISTDYVFDGISPPYSPSDEPNPLNSYGRSKRDGEKAVLSKGESGRVCVWRVPVLYGKAETHSESAVNCLLDVISPREESKGRVKMDAVAVRYPTSVEDVSRGLLSLSQIWYKSLSEEDSNAQSENGIVRGRVPPVLHFSAREAMTKQDMCFVLSRVQRALEEPTSTDHLEPVYEVDPNDTSRPRHVKLDLDLTERCGVDTKCIGFEEWWTPYLTELAVVARAKREEERLQREKEEAEERARKEEEESRRARQEAEERQKAKLEAEERKEIAERRKREAAEEASRQAEDLARKAAEETAKRREEELARRQAEEAAQHDAVTASSETPQFVEGEGVHASPPMQPQPQQPVSAEMHANNSSAAGVASSSSSVRARSPISRLAEENHAHASDSKPASLRLLGSPNAPSFSSLRARPTPPPTNISESGGNSPASANASVTRSQSTARNEDLEEDPLNLSANAEHGALVQGSSQAHTQDSNSASASGSASSATHMQASRDESYFPSLAVPRNDPGLDVRGQHAPSADVDTKVPNDGDSDGYGQPSPRESSVQFSQEDHHVPPAKDEEADQNRQAAQDAGSGVTPAHKQSWEVTNGKSTEAESTPVAPRPSFSIKVGDPQRKGDPVTAHITNHPAFRSEFSALRRYSDFRWLHAALVHNNPGVFIPPVPEKHKLGRFNPELVEARRFGLENCINKIANHRLLQEDEDLRLFLESVDFAADVRLRDIRKGPVPTPEQKTYFGWSNQMSAPKFHETDEWFGNQKNYLDHLETQLKNLVRAVSSVSQQRRDAASAISELSHALMMLSGSSLSRSLSTCFAGLGEVQRRSCELNDAQAEADMREMGAVLYEYERIVGSVRKAFATRIDVWQAWQKSEEEYRKVRSKHEKLTREGRSGGERMHMSLQDVADAESRSLGLKRDFDLVGLRCKDEMDRFDSEKVQEVRAAVESWIQGQIERQIEVSTSLHTRVPKLPCSSSIVDLRCSTFYSSLANGNSTVRC
ncbi:Vps5-domain-containing protein [Ceraceosorus guamensis]|uniref:Vps5-domain-containing protein n=1 Tax=Ceraceosorus guamensis TaxID=1522189 RepID=A0A316VZL8_9BASI|nr:Vps5-domain-containing protein [Ceraceosorus guamensis]PWN42724.1 Vps5-domain-containing protein [Ceraceosorus guamensis]